MIKLLITSTSFQDQKGAHLTRILSDKRFQVEMLRGPLGKEELKKHIKNFDAVICGDDEYDREVLSLAKGKLKVLSKYGVGLDRIDLKAAQEFGIIVKSCAGVNSTTVAEHVFALLLAHAKNIEQSLASVRQYDWTRPIGYDLKGKNFVIVGYGNIGKEVYSRAKAFGMNVAVYDPIAKLDADIKSFSNITQAFQWAEIVSLHCPLLDSNRQFVNESLLKEVKGLVLVNTARGGLIDEDAILEALKTDRLAAYLTDVLEEEPISKNSKLPQSRKVLITPHIASRTQDNILKQAEMALDNLYKELGFEK